MLLTSFAARNATAATISGTVVDASGMPIAGARVDHTGGLVVVPPTSLDVKPSPDETRTDADGRFMVTTLVPAFVVRKPGYISQRVLVAGDAHTDYLAENQSRITLQAVASAQGKDQEGK